jgi:Ca-activated chloride channel family protein
MKPAVLLILAFAVSLTGARVAGRQQATFRVNVDLVSVDVLVSRNGRPIAGLTPDDFEVYDNGVRQHIEGVAEGALQRTRTFRTQPVPLDVIFVFDTSESMAGERIQYLAQAARGVLERLRPIDRAALVTFSDRTVLQVGLSQDLAEVARSLDGMTANGRTSIFDAFYAALTLKRPGTRRSMVLLFTDGRDNASWLGANDVVQVARESDVFVYGVGLDSGASGDIKDLVETTGGDLIVATSAKQLKELFVRVIGEMQARYVLTYYPKGVKRQGWHAIDVKLVGKAGDIKARHGYYVPGD